MKPALCQSRRATVRRLPSTPAPPATVSAWWRSRHDRAQWEDSINLMVRRHNMPPLDDEDRERVLNYLETACPPRAPAGRGGWVNPFAK
jgi:hypothetical protein